MEGEILHRNDIALLPGLHARTRLARAAPKRQPGIVVVVAGTRPECIKLAPVIRELADEQSLRAVIVNSGQHAATVRRTFAGFGIECDVELAQMPALPNLAAASRHL